MALLEQWLDGLNETTQCSEFPAAWEFHAEGSTGDLHVPSTCEEALPGGAAKHG